MTRNIALSLGMLVFCALMYWETFNFPEASRFRAGPEVFPRFILLIIAGLSAILLIRSLVTERHSLKNVEFDFRVFAREYWLVIALFALFGVYVVALTVVGFVPATLVFLMAGQIMIARRTDAKTLGIAAAVTIFATLSISYIFSQVLRIWLP